MTVSDLVSLLKDSDPDAVVYIAGERFEEEGLSPPKIYDYKNFIVIKQ